MVSVSQYFAGMLPSHTTVLCELTVIAGAGYLN
jgi:hypothetical protein